MKLTLSIAAATIAAFCLAPVSSRALAAPHGASVLSAPDMPRLPIHEAGRGFDGHGWGNMGGSGYGFGHGGGYGYEGRFGYENGYRGGYGYRGHGGHGGRYDRGRVYRGGRDYRRGYRFRGRRGPGW